MKTLFKNFIYILKSFTTSSLINFLGLTGAISVFLVCMIQTGYDYTYNRNFKDSDKIMQLYVTNNQNDNIDLHLSTPLIQRIGEASPVVESYAATSPSFEVPFHVGEDILTIEVTQVKPGFEKIFQPEVIHGNLALGLEKGGHAVLTASEAKRLFGKTDVVGEFVRPYMSSGFMDREEVHTIEAVIKDFPQNCSFTNGLYMYLNDFPEEEGSFLGYFKVKDKEMKALEELINSRKFWGVEDEEDMEMNERLNFISLQDYPQDSRFGNRRSRMISFFMVGLIVLIVAYINFINFSLTMAPSRVKSLNIHRILGLSKKRQQWVIISESILFTLISFLFSLLILSVVAGSDLSTLFDAKLTLSDNTSSIVICGLVLVGISILSGYYPARYATAFQETEALKGGSLSGIRSKRPREILLLLQLCTACVLPILTAFVHMQHHYMVNYSWGLEKENIVYFNAIPTNQQFETLVKRLQENPAIIDFTSSRFVPGKVGMGWGRMWKEKKVALRAWPVYPNFLTFFGVEMAEGENFPEQEDGTERIIFNQKFVDLYASDSNPVGDEFPGFTGFLPVCGIAKDVNFESLHSEIGPMGFITIASQNKGILFLKIAKGTPLREVIPWIESLINEKSDVTVSLTFLDQALNNLYTKENNQAKLITIFSIIILLITMMGVYGLVSSNVKFRQKEIALRKVNGATERQVVLMLNRNLLYLFGIAYVLAIPLAYLLSKKWIEQFAYRTELVGWVFLLIGLLVLLITLLTVSFKSHRAALKNPIISLKSE